MRSSTTHPRHRRASLLATALLAAVGSVAAQDDDGPSAELVAPLADATSVPPSTDLRIVFDAPMARDTVLDAIEISPAVACRFAWNDANTELTCQHVRELAPDTNYAVRLHASAQGADGTELVAALESSFRTGVSATPRVLSSTPSAGQNVARDALLVLTFSVPMDRNSTEAALRFPHDESVSGSVTWSEGDTVLTFTPSTPWAHGYESAWSSVRVGAEARSASGAQLGAPFDLHFSLARQSVLSIPATCAGIVGGGGTSPAVTVDWFPLFVHRDAAWRSVANHYTLHVLVTDSLESEHGSLLVGQHAPTSRVPTSAANTQQFDYDVTADIAALGPYPEYPEPTNIPPISYPIDYPAGYTPGASVTSITDCQLSAHFD